MPKMNVSDSDGDKYVFDILNTDNQKLNAFTQSPPINAERLTKTIRVHGPIAPNSVEKELLDQKLWGNLRSSLNKGSFFGRNSNNVILGADVQINKGDIIDGTRRWYELTITIDYEKP